MQYIKTTGTESIQIAYQDFGKGKNVVFIHGWPSNHKMWEYQLGELPHNYRCIAYDRRGFGCSDKPWSGYDYDTLASDLNDVINGLNLTDVTLVGFSMGGGEVARYLSKYGDSKISKIVLISSVLPFMLKTVDNEMGIPQEMFDGIEKEIKKDRPAFLATFGKMFFGVNMVSHPVSADLLDWAHCLCLKSTQKATIDCMRSFSETDFRKDCENINVPTLIIHGDSDKTVPIEISSEKTVKLIKNSTLIIYEGEPHGIFVTQKERLNQDLIDFIG
ncbi:MAG: alpha/beta hydrolase [Bacteroidia bacterium]|nr:alpha/beta hydrolase [Bacteroidia bacterium]